MFEPTAPIEDKLRKLLEWPKVNDELISIVYGSTFAEGEIMPAASHLPIVLSANDESIEPVSKTQRLKKDGTPWGRRGSHKSAGTISDDDLEGLESGELRGTVVA